MSEEVFCDSALLTQIYYIIYAEPYLYASCVVYGDSTASNIIKIDSDGNASVLFTFGNDDIYSSLVYVDGYIFAPLLTRLYQISTTGTNYNIYYNIFPASNANAITYLNNYLYITTAADIADGSASGSATGYIYKVPINNLNPTTVITAFPDNISPLSITNDSTYLYTTCNNYNNDPFSTAIYQINVSGQILNSNLIIGTPPTYFFNCLFYSNYFYISLTNGMYGVSQYNAEGELINANFAAGGSNIYDLDGNNAEAGGGYTFDNQGNMYISSQTSGTTSVINIIRGAATPPQTLELTPAPAPAPKPIPIYNICFRGDTLIKTDQGYIAISKINPSHHTIQNQQIEAITETIGTDNFLVCFRKNALGYNYPNKDTYLSMGHKVYYKGQLLQSYQFLKLKNVVLVKYNKNPLYNILMKTHRLIKAHNMLCETLSPTDIISELFRKNFTKKVFNETVIKLNRNSKPSNYGQYKKILRNLYKNINNY